MVKQWKQEEKPSHPTLPSPTPVPLRRRGFLTFRSRGNATKRKSYQICRCLDQSRNGMVSSRFESVRIRRAGRPRLDYLKVYPTVNFTAGLSMSPTFSSAISPRACSTPRRKLTPGWTSERLSPNGPPSCRNTTSDGPAPTYTLQAERRVGNQYANSGFTVTVVRWSPNPISTLGRKVIRPATVPQIEMTSDKELVGIGADASPDATLRPCCCWDESGSH